MDQKPRSEVLQSIVEAAGEEALRGLLAARGGLRAYFPSPELLAKRGESHWLAQAVGMPAAIKIASVFPNGGEVDLPMGERSNRAVYQSRVRAACLSGVSSNAMAAAADCNRRTIFRYRAKMRKEGLL